MCCGWSGTRNYVLTLIAQSDGTRHDYGHRKDRLSYILRVIGAALSKRNICEKYTVEYSKGQLTERYGVLVISPGSYEVIPDAS